MSFEFVSSGAAHNVRGFGAFLVSIFGRGALAAIMRALVATRPAVVTGVMAFIWVASFFGKLRGELGVCQ